MERINQSGLGMTNLICFLIFFFTNKFFKFPNILFKFLIFLKRIIMIIVGGRESKDKGK